ncbi:MAG: ABC transporter ATP-binding protein [Coriobacteriia bacterium]
MDAISTNGLTKFYGRNRGVEDLTMHVPRGAVYGFLGPNGAGKTTTIRCLLGMLRMTAGEATVLSQPVTLGGAALRKRVGYVAGDVRLYSKETGRWHLDYVAGFRGGRGALAEDLIERFGLDTSKRVRELSKGNRQKLALILGMAHDPELLVLDEPTSGLDPFNQEVVYSLIRERVAEGRTVFLSSHVLSEVERVCDHIGVIRSGRLVAEEGVKALLGKRVREIEATFAEPVGPEFLAGVPGVDSVTAIGETTLSARAKGDVLDGVIKRLAERRIVDVRIQQASLEDVFMEFYRDEPGRTPGSSDETAAPPAEEGERR